MKEKKYIRKKRKRGYGVKLFGAMVFVILLGIVVVHIKKNSSADDIASKYSITEELEPFNVDIEKTKPLDVDIEETKPLDVEVKIDNIYSQYAVLYDWDTWSQLYGKNAAEKMYPASLTKIMTALLLIEHSDRLEKKVRLDADMFDSLYQEGASMAGFLPDEVVKEKDLLYGTLLPSGAECSIGIANYISGSESGFVEMMNEKAKELGMKNTHFINCTGLYDPDHYSTCEDMALLLKYSLKYDVFRQAFTSARYSTSSTNKHPGGITSYSRLFNDLPDATLSNGEILGGKTGYTGEAGLCLATLAEVGGKEYILVTAKAEGNHNTEPFHILDAKKIYDAIQQKEKN